MHDILWAVIVGALIGGLGLAVWAVHRRVWRPAQAPPVFYTGRQQLRQAARTEAYRQVGGAPIGRRVKRQAARDLARHVMGGD